MVPRPLTRLGAAAIAGVIAPHALILCWGALVLHIWFPTFKYLAQHHHIYHVNAWANGDIFDAFVGLSLGIPLAMLLAVLLRGVFLRGAIAFFVAFLASLLLSGISDGADVAFVLRQPLILTFSCTIVLGLTLAARRVPRKPVVL